MFRLKKGKIWTIISIFVLLLQILAESLVTGILLKLDMLPDKYVLVIVALMVLLVLFVALLLFVKIRHRISTVRRILAILLAIVVIFGCFLANKYATEAYKTMHQVSSGNKVTNVRNMYVLVLTDDPAQALKDTAGYTFGVIEGHDVSRVEKLTEQIGAESGSVPTPAGYEKAADLADALLGKQVKAVILSGASIALLIEEETYETFLDKVKILYSVPYDALDEKDTEETEPTTPPDPEKNVTNTPFVVYVSGSDTRSSMLSVSRSDVNILMVINPQTKQVLLLNTPRDYYVGNPAGDGALDKLTHCGLYGVDCSMEALETLYNTQIEYYGQINFTGFETLIDAIGGITVYSDQSFKAYDTYIQKGENTLNGAQALKFARERYHVSGGDNGRGKNQMKVISAVIKKMTSGSTIISNYSAIMSSLEGMFSTNLQSSDISSLVKMQLSDMAKWDVFSFAVTGTGGSEKTYSAPGHNAYVMYPNEKSVAHASELIQKILSGELLTEETVAMPK